MKLRVGTISVVVTAAAFILFSHCKLPPSFGPEYYDSSINYIAGFPLALPPDPSDLGTGTELGAPGVWDWAWRGKMDNPHPYMTLTDAGEARPGGGQAWTLELVNLFTNGTYEAPLGLGHYIENPPSVSVTTVPGIIHSTALRIEANTQNYAVMDMSQLLADIPQSNFTYYIRLLVEPQSAFSFASQFITGITQAPDPVTGSLFLTDEFSGFDVQGFSIGSESNETNLYLDEVRVVRADHQGDMKLRLLLRPQDTYPSLVMGYYEFSVWARIPPDYLKFDDTAARTLDPEAPYASASITLSVSQIVSTSGSKGGSSETFGLSDSWDQIVLQLPRDSNIEIFDEKYQMPIIELSILPGYPGQDMDAGAVQIADPSLNFFIDNY